MSIRAGDKANFKAIQDVFTNGDERLIECETAEGNYVAVICAAMTVLDDGREVLMPIARMFQGNPYDEVVFPEDSVTTDPEKP